MYFRKRTCENNPPHEQAKVNSQYSTGNYTLQALGENHHHGMLGLPGLKMAWLVTKTSSMVAGRQVGGGTQAADRQCKNA